MAWDDLKLEFSVRMSHYAVWWALPIIKMVYIACSIFKIIKQSTDSSDFEIRVIILQTIKKLPFNILKICFVFFPATWLFLFILRGCLEIVKKAKNKKKDKIIAASEDKIILTDKIQPKNKNLRKEKLFCLIKTDYLDKYVELAAWGV